MEFHKLVFSSPDSDDTYPGDEQEEDFSMRDDQFLVSDRTENKFYGNNTSLKSVVFV